MRFKSFLAFMFLGFVFAGCTVFKVDLPVAEGLPGNLPDTPFEESPYFAQLIRTYGNGHAHEHAKILYLLDSTRETNFQYIRNGFYYDSNTTMRHLRKKYKQRLDRIRTAQQFIDDVASLSSQTGRPYLAVPGDGHAYPTGPILQYELDRLEAYLDQQMQGFKA